MTVWKRGRGALLGSWVVVVALAGAVRADVVCDGVDDRLLSSAATNQFVSTTEGTLMIVVKPSAASVETSTDCFTSEQLLGDIDGWLGLARGGNIAESGLEEVCAYNYVASEQRVVASAPPNHWTHLTWHHSAGILSLYVDGVPSGQVATAATGDALNAGLTVCGVDNGAFPGIVALGSTYSTALSAAVIAAVGASGLHWLVPEAATGLWPLADCGDGQSGHGVTFRDESGADRHLIGNHQYNLTGLTCSASTFMAYPWGVE